MANFHEMLASRVESVISDIYDLAIPQPTLEQCREVLAKNPDPTYGNMAALAAVVAAVPIGILTRKIRHMIYTKDKRVEFILATLKTFEEEAATQKKIELGLREQIETFRKIQTEQDKFEKEILGKMANLHMEITTHKQELVFVEAKNKDLGQCVTRMMTFFGNSEIMSDQLLDMASLSLSLLDEYSQKLDIEKQLKAISEKDNLFLQEQVFAMTAKNDKKNNECALLLEKVGSMDGQIKLKDQECSQLNEAIVVANENCLEKSLECCQLRDAILKMEEDHKVAMSCQNECNSIAFNFLMDKLQSLQKEHCEILEKHVQLVKAYEESKAYYQNQGKECEEKERKCQELEQLKERLTKKNEDQESKCQELEQLKEHLTKENKDKERKCQELEQLKAHLIKESEDKERKCQELEQLKEHLTKENEDKERKCQELEQLKENLIKENGEKEKKCQELKCLTKEDEELVIKYQELEQLKEHLIKENEEKERKCQELEQLKGHLIKENEDKERNCQELEQFKEHLIKENEDKERKCQELEQLTEHFTKEKEEKERKCLELEHLTKDNEEIKRKWQELEQLKEHLIKENEDKERNCQELVRFKEHLTKENEEKGNKCQELEYLNKENEELVRKCEKLEQLKEHLTKENEEKESKLKALKEANIMFYSEKQILDHVISGYERTSLSKIIAIDDLKKEIAANKTKMAIWEENCKSKDREMEDLMKKLKDLEKKLAKSKSAVQEGHVTGGGGVAHNPQDQHEDSLEHSCHYKKVADKLQKHLNQMKNKYKQSTSDPKVNELVPKVGAIKPLNKDPAEGMSGSSNKTGMAGKKSNDSFHRMASPELRQLLLQRNAERQREHEKQKKEMSQGAKSQKKGSDEDSVDKEEPPDT